MTIRRRGRAEKIVRAVIAYVLASIALTVVFFEIGAGGGHADIPFTMFPDYLVVAPVLPLLVIWNLNLGWRMNLLSLAAFVVTFVVVWVAMGALLARSRSASTDGPWKTGRPDRE